MAVTATYLLRADESTLEDYRRCSLQEQGSGCANMRRPGPGTTAARPGYRLLRSINEKLAQEGLDEYDFED